MNLSNIKGYNIIDIVVVYLLLKNDTAVQTSNKHTSMTDSLQLKYTTSFWP